MMKLAQIASTKILKVVTPWGFRIVEYTFYHTKEKKIGIQMLHQDQWLRCCDGDKELLYDNELEASLGCYNLSNSKKL